MKKYLVCCLFLGAIMLVLTGMPLSFVHIDSSTTAYAMGHRGDRDHGNRNDHGNRHDQGGGNDQGGSNNNGNPGYKVPEPTTLALMGTGLAGIGVFYFVRRRNRK